MRLFFVHNLSHAIKLVAVRIKHFPKAAGERTSHIDHPRCDVGSRSASSDNHLVVLELWWGTVLVSDQ